MENTQIDEEDDNTQEKEDGPGTTNEKSKKVARRSVVKEEADLLKDFEMLIAYILNGGKGINLEQMTNIKVFKKDFNSL